MDAGAAERHLFHSAVHHPVLPPPGGAHRHSESVGGALAAGKLGDADAEPAEPPDVPAHGLFLPEPEAMAGAAGGIGHRALHRGGHLYDCRYFG